MLVKGATGIDRWSATPTLMHKRTLYSRKNIIHWTPLQGLNRKFTIHWLLYHKYLGPWTIQQPAGGPSVIENQKQPLNPCSVKIHIQSSPKQFSESKFNSLRRSDWYIHRSVNCIIIGSSNGLSSVRRQTFTWTNPDLLIRPLGTHFNYFFWESAFEIVVCKMSSILYRP